MGSILTEAAKEWIAEKTPDTWPCMHLTEEGLNGLFYAGVPFHNKPTRIFAWLGLPKGASVLQRVPGVVLVHGGGGTAFARWVRWWCDRGFAAIAMDTCGAMPLPDTGILGSAAWPRHSHSGPPGWGSFDQASWPLQDQWVYHAAAAIVNAHSLLASLPEVDQDRIGVTGVSWGGFLTCLAAGIDSRFCCAAPVYGCGFVSDESVWTENGSFATMTDLQFQTWQKHWDPASVLPLAKMPMLWLSGSNDFAYWPPIWQKSAASTCGQHQLCLKVRWPHGHIPESEQTAEIESFFKMHLMGGQPMLTISPPTRTGNSLSATYTGSQVVRYTSLIVTPDQGSWPERQWHHLPATIDRDAHIVKAEFPDGTTAAYLSLISEDWLYTTSDLVFLRT